MPAESGNPFSLLDAKIKMDSRVRGNDANNFFEWFADSLRHPSTQTYCTRRRK